MKRLVRLFAVALFMSFVVSVFYYKIISPEPTDGPAGPKDLGGPTVDVPKEDENRVLVVVSEVKLEPYERVIEESMVKRIKYPEKLLPRYAPLDVKDVLGKLPTEPIYRGEIVSLQGLVDKDEYKQSPRRLIPPGQRALSILVSSLSGVSGFVTQGDIVDLVAVYNRTIPGGGPGGRDLTTQTARIILQNIRVLIVGNRYNPVAGENPLGVIEGDLSQKPITFAVNPKDAAIIHHIVQMGGSSFRILLKHSEDQQMLSTDGFSFLRLQDETRKIVKRSDPNSATKEEFKTVQHTIEQFKGKRRMPDEVFEERVRVN